MKGKSRANKDRKENETPDKFGSDDCQSYNADNESLNKSIELIHPELRITQEMLQQTKHPNTNFPRQLDVLNTQDFIIRKPLPPDQIKLPTKKYCVMRRLNYPPPGDLSSTIINNNGESSTQTEAAIPFPAMLEQDGTGPRIDELGRVVEHSILGSSEEFFRTALFKNRISLNDIPPEYHHSLGYGEPRRPISVMFPRNFRNYQQTNKGKNEQRSSESARTSRMSGRVAWKHNKKVDPDTSALLLWQQRMSERRKLQSHISKAVERTPENLIFNSGDFHRSKCEIDYMVSKAIPYYGPGYGFRTGSEFWNQNEEVGKDPDLMIHMANTLTQKGYPPPVLHIDVPDKVREEKGQPIARNTSRSGVYFAQRYSEVQGIIKELDPHEPDMPELVIAGQKIRRKYQKSASNIVSNRDEMQIDENKENEDLAKEDTEMNIEVDNNAKDLTMDQIETIDGPGIIINDQKFPMVAIEASDDNGSKTDKPNTYEIRKVLSGLEGTLCTGSIKFQNYGSSVIRLWWKKMDVYDPFNLDNKHDRRFYFNIQDVILLPRQQIDFPVTFKSNNSGIFTEKWKLETIPEISKNSRVTEIVISLRGIALLNDVTQPVRVQIQDFLKFQVAENVCLDILSDILEDVHYRHLKKGENKDEELEEADEFHLLNNEFPYNFDVIQSLRKLYSDLQTKDSKNKEPITEADWNLELAYLRNALLNTSAVKSDKKIEMTEKFYKSVDKLMIVSNKNCMTHKNSLFQIGYRQILQFFDDMYESLHDLRLKHDLPEMDLKISRDRRKTNFNRQKTNMSQASKSSSKKQSISSNKTIPTVTSKSREPTTLQFLETQDTQILEQDESVIEEETVEPDPPATTVANDSTASETMDYGKSEHCYHYKTYQTVHGLLNSTIDQIIDYWSEVTIE